MPHAGFSVIEQYTNLVKDLEQQSNYDMLGFDQEVPQSCKDLDMKTVIKMEADDSHQDIYSFMFPNSNDISDSHHYSSNTFADTVSSNYKLNYISDSRFTPSPSPSPYLSTSPAPMLSSTPTTLPGLPAVVPQTQIFSSTITTANNNSSLPSSKTTTYVTELGGSGCTVVSSLDYSLSEATGSALPPLGMQDDSLEYIDLDKQPTSLYDDIGPFSPNNLKPSVDSALSDESNSVPLEEAVILMRDVIQSDCDSLNVPYDPLKWSPDHVNKWLSWVCEKNNLPNVSNQLCGLDGRTLCSMHPETFVFNYGPSGHCISTELELWKAANSCFPSHGYGPNPSDVSMHPPQHLHNSYMESPQTFSLAPCVSPAPSTCSSTHDSSSGSTLSTHSDHSEDEGGYSSTSYHPSSNGDHKNFRGRLTGKMPTGRGHKQTIHLWQFLKELLVSKENHTDCIRWLDRKTGIFKIEDSKKVAHLWGARKNRPAMNYDKLSRSVRQYYKKGIIKKTEQSKRLVYQFCPEYL